MIKVNVFYPNQPGIRFDMAYYLDRHMPMVAERLKPAVKGVSVDIGINGGAPEAPSPNIAAAVLLFDSVEAFQAAMAPHAAELMGDIPNYTDVTPVIQISEVKTIF